jgi:hypothetical protein
MNSDQNRSGKLQIKRLQSKMAEKFKHWTITKSLNIELLLKSLNIELLLKSLNIELLLKV